MLLSTRVLDLLDLADSGRQEPILEQTERDVRHRADGTGAEPVQREPIKRWRSLAALLGLVIPLMWLASGLLLYLIIGLQFWVAMLTVAVMTPTDPIVSSAIVTGSVAKENLPDVDRHTLSAESGANYGLAYPFVRLL